MSYSAEELIAWMEKVRHVDRDLAKDLHRRGRLTRLHAAYFRLAGYGETFASFRARWRGTDGALS
jgi:hypothetical protein